MKTGLTTSMVMHAALIAFGLFSLSAPKAFDVADVESLPVDMVSISEYSQIVQGDKKAPAAEKPAPVPTKRADPVKDAENTGDNSVDLKTPPTPDPRPRPVETAALPKTEPVPVPAPKPEKKPVVEKPAEPKPVPATEVKPDPTPKQELTPEPSPEPVIAENPDAQSVKLPETAPVPQARPKPPKAETAKAPERKNSEKPVREAAAKPKQEESEFDADAIAALLNKEKASGGGAKRSEQVAALGNKETSTAQQLSQGELDALRSQLEGCWNPPVGSRGSSEFTASVKFQVGISRQLDSAPQIIKSSGNRQFDDSVIRAVHICNDRGFLLPEGKQAVWADIVVNFDPSQMY